MAVGFRPCATHAVNSVFLIEYSERQTPAYQGGPRCQVMNGTKNGGRPGSVGLWGFSF